MRGSLSKWHRRLGVFAASIAIFLSLTGILLNHSHDLGLNESRVSNTVLLKIYGVKPPTGTRVATKQHIVDKLGQALFLDDQLLGQYASTLIGVVELEQMIVIALNNSILLFSTDGELIETLSSSNGLPGQVQAIGQSASLVIIRSSGRLYKINAEFLDWLSGSNLNTPVSWSGTSAIPPESKIQLTRQLPAYGPSWERLLQDLHSGRFFKLPGTLLVDLTGVILLLLSISGIISFTIRKKTIRRNKKLLKDN